ncbi:glycosyltransferase [Candidatus Pelagibacter sp.]|jgi:glycosyltransferase involved in cell wall biosynthesis|nr:glycosyltransferase [Candidatus Pelagibacter sp.]
MKIFYWSPFFTNIATIKAVIWSAESLIKFYKKEKIDVSLINSIGEWDNFEKQIDKNINIINLNKIKLLDYLPKNGFIKSRISYIIIFFWNIIKLKNLVNKEEPNFLIIHLMTSLPIFLTLFFNKNTKIILRISGLPKINLLRFLFWKLFSNRIDRVTCPTKATYDFIIKKKIFKKEKVLVLSDPIINMKEFLVKKKNNLLPVELANVNYILGIGRLTKQKNFALLINFFINISNKHKNIHLVIIGDGEEKESLKKISARANIESRVHLLGYQENVFKFLLKSKCFILSSLWEDPGFVLVEAALSNSNIISSDCPNGPKEIIQNNGYLFKNNDVDDLTIKFEKFLKESENDSYKNKIELKKRIRIFTQYNHYKNLNKLI